MRSVRLLTLAALAAALAAPVEAKTWTCAFARQQGKGGLIPEKVVIQHNESTGAVTVVDPFINNYLGSPLAGLLKSQNATRLLFKWDLPSLQDASGNWIPGITFNVNITRATGAASISAKPSGNYKAERGSGTCQ